jgi:hypothetical protein
MVGKYSVHVRPMIRPGLVSLAATLGHQIVHKIGFPYTIAPLVQWGHFLPRFSGSFFVGFAHPRSKKGWSEVVARLWPA